MEVRSFRGEDRDGVVALWARAFPHDPPRNEPSAMLDRKLSVDDLVWVAHASGEVVGAVMAGYDGVRGWIYHLAVEEAYRRRGVARALVRAAEAELAARGCPKINLQVRATNAQVIAFYEGLGYSVEDNASLGRVLAPDS